MEFLLICGILLSISLAFIILKKDRELSDLILAFWLVIIGINFLAEYFLFIRGDVILLGFTYSMPAFDTAMLYIYVASLAGDKQKFKPIYLLHFAPFIIANVIMLIYILNLSEFERNVFLDETTFSTRPLFFHIIQFFMLIIVPVYLIWIYIALKNHIKNIKQKFSWKENIDLFWVNYLLWSIAIFWVVLFATKVMNGYYNTLQFNEITSSISVIELLLIITIGYFGLKQGIIFITPKPLDKKQENNTQEKYKSTGLSSEDAKNFLPKLLNYMNTEKPYLDGELTLFKLATQLNIHSHHLSQIINEHMEMNFFEFINQYRVKEVKQKMVDNQDGKYTLLALALDSGFNSKSSFNNVFKKITLQTPKEFSNSL